MPDVVRQPTGTLHWAPIDKVAATCTCLTSTLMLTHTARIIFVSQMYQQLADGVYKVDELCDDPH